MNRVEKLVKDETDKNPGLYSYKDIYRYPGSGLVRIGEGMETRCDLYSMLFVSALRPEYIAYYDK